MNAELLRLIDVDTQLVGLAKNIKLLSSLTWPRQVGEEFLSNFQRGRCRSPKPEYPKYDFKELRGALKRLVAQCDRSHPYGEYLVQTAASYIVACHMLENIDTPVFYEFSSILYGSSRERIGAYTNLQFAQSFLELTFLEAEASREEGDPQKFEAEEAAVRMRQAADNAFYPGAVEVIVDPGLTAKAAAGAERVRLRADTEFTSAEIEQLINHELYVHTATARNGRGQPYFKCLGLGAPRTTCVQEGLATFAEFAAAALDIERLKRLAYRITAVHMASEGADFVEVFRYFRDVGHEDREAYLSASRVFRGSVTHRKCLFTKDVVYLKGFCSVYTFLCNLGSSVEREHRARRLFTGRVTIADVLRLEPLFAVNLLAKPVFLPPWVDQVDERAGVFGKRLSAMLDKIELTDLRSDIDLYAVV